VNSLSDARVLWDFGTCCNKFGAINTSGRDDSPRFQLPVGWNTLDDFVDALKDQILWEADLERPSPSFWIAFHVPLLGIAMLGWVLLVIGVITAILRPPGESDFHEQSFRSVSDAHLLSDENQAPERRRDFVGFNLS
jgi:hypothetical protein